MDKSKRNKQHARVATDAPKELTHSPFAKLAVSTPAAMPDATVDAEPVKVASPSPPPALRGRLILRRETKRRGGKAVVVVSGFPAESAFDSAALTSLASELKHALACGGTVEGSGEARELVLQGDQPGHVAELLRARGFKVGGVTS